MGRKRNADPLDQARRLHEAKRMIKDSGRATPQAARDLRQDALDVIDEIIVELATPARLRKAAAGQ